ncbi:kinase-like protein [Ophiobolus disseminans]|uniref:Kinase-like protein n=1 Tax=Ophiobolus disseminans TaxID=1469910 RepID=A0A6A6ZHD8_9PLEO|nr:kinase-like protein [Ophiobolus disseminans]
MATQGYEEELLQHWFPTTEQESEAKHFVETDIREISTILERRNKAAWSRIPRIYIVLRLIGKLDAIDDLPEALRYQAGHSGFIDAQKRVFNSKAFDLERPDARHGHFHSATDVPLKKIGDLGKGGSGFVERVISTITHKEYALKLIKRGQTFKKDKRVLRDFEKELSTLKKLSQAHRHIIDLVGSYTEPRYVGILFPVADCNLSEFVEQPNLDDSRWALRTYFGCLASGLSFLHEYEMRHKDIKPQNILIKDNQPYFTDFGLAVDWSEVGHSTTQGPTGLTPRYCAPDVVAWEPRNSSSDVWSLGCVFLEMWAVLKHTSMQNLPVIPPLMIISKPLPGPASDSLPAVWIRHMLLRDRHDRWPTQSILDSIRDHGADHTTQYLYIGRCCLDEEDTAESVVSHVSSNEPSPLLKLKPTGKSQNKELREIISSPEMLTEVALIETPAPQGNVNIDLERARTLYEQKLESLAAERTRQMAELDRRSVVAVQEIRRMIEEEELERRNKEAQESLERLARMRKEESLKSRVPPRSSGWAESRPLTRSSPHQHLKIPQSPSFTSVEEYSDGSAYRRGPERRKRGKGPKEMRPIGSGFIGAMKSIFTDPKKDTKKVTSVAKGTVKTSTGNSKRGNERHKSENVAQSEEEEEKRHVRRAERRRARGEESAREEHGKARALHTRKDDRDGDVKVASTSQETGAKPSTRRTELGYPKLRQTQGRLISVDSETSAEDEKARYQAAYQRRSQEEEAQKRAADARHKVDNRRERKLVSISSASSAESERDC